MKINNISSQPSFKGHYYFTSDVHSKPVHAVGLLQKISDKAQNEKTSIYLDNGDIYTDYPKLLTDIYTTFAKKNPHIQSVFNLGNAEMNYLDIDAKGLSENIKSLSKSGITVVCTPFKQIQERKGITEDFSAIKPYAIVKDTVNGEEKDILVVGSLDARNTDILSIDDQAKILADTIKEAKEKHNPYKTILLSHNFINDTKTILDKLSEQGIDDIEIVCGGHSHQIEDAMHNGTRILHPAAQGKSAYHFELKNDGFHMQKVAYDKENRYDYTMQETQNNPDIIPNFSINLAKLDKEYTDILSKTHFINRITKCTTPIDNRIKDTVSNPSEFGSVLANKVKELTNADIGLMLSQDIRGDLPKVGEDIYQYHISDLLGADKTLYVMNVNKEQLFNIFNVSLKEQHNNVSNSDFLEYSNNVIVERYPDIPDEKITAYRDDGATGLKNQRVKEIYIKQGDDFVPVSTMDDNKTFSIATCRFVANGRRASLGYFTNITDKKEFDPNLFTKEILTEAVRDVQTGKTSKQKSIMLNA